MRVLNADSKLNSSHLLTPPRTVQRHHSAQIRVPCDSSRYINLLVVVVVVVVVVVLGSLNYKLLILVIVLEELVTDFSMVLLLIYAYLILNIISHKHQQKSICAQINTNF